MLKPGVHENIVTEKVFKNDKGQLVIKFKAAGEIDPLAALNGSGSTSFEQAEQDIIPYDIKVENFGKTSTWIEMRNSIADYKDPLTHIASAYMTSDKMKWDILAGTGINGQNMEQKFVEQETIAKIQANINDQFIKMMSTVTGLNSKKVRLILIRFLVAKHYPTLRKRYLDSNPFIEPMDVPVSKVKFTKYEIEKGLNNPNPVGAATTVDKLDAEQANNLFA